MKANSTYIFAILANYILCFFLRDKYGVFIFVVWADDSAEFFFKDELDSSLFRINSKTGDLHLLEMLDYEYKSEVLCSKL